MAGTIYGLGLSQQIDENGEPRNGCLLYLYEAGTSTPVTTYKDFALTSGNEHPFPIVSDAAGRIPAFWVADGAYRVKLTTSGGSTIFDESSITAIGASSGTTSGGGVSTEALFQTGDTLFTFDTARTGWVRMNGRTIGSSASGGTERANGDTESLFTFLWNKLGNGQAAVSSGRGASAAADFAANKTIALPDMRGKGPFGVDDMGNTDAAVIGSTVMGGANAVTTWSMTTAQLVAHGHGSTGITASGATHTHSNTSHSHAAGTYTGDSHTHNQGTLYTDSHSHGAGTLVTDSHSHSAGTLVAATHSHAAGTLVGDAHSHSAGTLTADAHSHASGTLSGTSHSHGAGSYTADAHSHGAGTLVGSSHTHTYSLTFRQLSVGTTGGGNTVDYISDRTTDTGATTVDITGATANSTANVSGTSSLSSVAITGSVASATANVSGFTATATNNISGATAVATADITGNTGATTVNISGNTAATTVNITGNTGGTTVNISGASANSTVAILASSVTVTISGSVDSVGGSTAIDNKGVIPYVLGSWFIKL